MATADSTLPLEQLRLSLESPAEARSLLQGWHLRDLERGYSNLVHLSRSLPLEALCDLCFSLQRLLPRCPDPDMALNNLEHFLANPLSVEQFPVLLEQRGRGLEILLHLFSTSHFFSDLLSLNPDFLDMLRVPLRRSPSLAELQAQLQSDVGAARDDESVLRAFRRFRQRHNLRIGGNDIIRDRPLEEITRDLSRVADAAVEVALATAMRSISLRASVSRPLPAASRAIASCWLSASTAARSSITAATST